MTTVDVVIEDTRWDTLRLAPLATRTIETGLQALKIADDFEVAILACDDPTIAKLNADFRGKPQPTNVLSWPAQDLAPLMPGEQPAPPDRPDSFENGLGDIALAFDTCLQEATDQGKSLEDHVTHLILHGLLHLLGYDHETEPDAEIMEQIETEILAEMGVSDPYSPSVVGNDRI